MKLGRCGFIAGSMAATVVASTPSQFRDYGQDAQPQRYPDWEILVLVVSALSMLKPMVLHIA